QGALARRADALDLVERIAGDVLLAAGPVRADGEAMGLVAKALHIVEHRVAMRQHERLAALHEELLAAGVPFLALGDTDEDDLPGEVEPGDDLAYGVELAPTAVDEDDIRPVRHARRLVLRVHQALRREAAEASGQHLPHHAEVVARRQL